MFLIKLQAIHINDSDDDSDNDSYLHTVMESVLVKIQAFTINVCFYLHAVVVCFIKASGLYYE